ncbi:hypothetical protein, partial [Agrobacterium rosae]|uniref:hypothetical protein n=1 Tax=Agrobacterium rosae TaxID=1972867 RepID=UPI001324940E
NSSPPPIKFSNTSKWARIPSSNGYLTSALWRAALDPKDNLLKERTFSLRPQTVIRHRLSEAFNQRVLGNNFRFPEEGYIAGDGCSAPKGDMCR